MKSGGQPLAPWQLGLIAIAKAPRCCAKTRKGTPCRGMAMRNGRCRMHGGKSPGAPRGNKNAQKTGYYSAEARALRRQARAAVVELNNTIEAIEVWNQTTTGSGPGVRRDPKDSKE